MEGKVRQKKKGLSYFIRAPQPHPSCQTCFYYFSERNLQTFSGEAAKQTASEAPWDRFIALFHVIEEGFVSRQSQKFYVTTSRPPLRRAQVLFTETMISGCLVIKVQRVLRLRVEETAYRYGT
jgi:hypothetical protein